MKIPPPYIPDRDPFDPWWTIHPSELKDSDVVLSWRDYNRYPVIANPAYPLAKLQYQIMQHLGRVVYAICCFVMKPFKSVHY